MRPYDPNTKLSYLLFIELYIELLVYDLTSRISDINLNTLKYSNQMNKARYKCSNINCKNHKGLRKGHDKIHMMSD